MNKGSTYEGNVKVRSDIRVIKHGLRIPSHVDNYQDFVREISISERDFMHILESYVPIGTT